MTELRFIPALRYRSLTRFYDPAVRWALREREFKAQLVEQGSVAPGDRVLDLGYGTATLSLMVKRTHPKHTLWASTLTPTSYALRAKEPGGLD